jgi:ribose transport system ATP-binding protein
MDNLFLGREPNRFGVIERGRVHGESASWLSKVGAGQIDVDRAAGTLSIGLQQLVEVAKALSLNARVLIMDEPTASLTDREIGTLFKIMTDLKSRGVGIVYVSHRMEEIFKICDKVSVLRDGHFVGERAVADTSFDEVVKMMVGRELKERFPKREVSLGPVRLKVDDLADQGHITGIHFEVRSGEVLGVAGLIGAGRSRILNTLFGVNRSTSGKVLLDGAALSIENPADAIAAGIGFVTEDRKSQGLVLGLSLRENITLVHLGKFARAGIIDRKAEQAAVKDLMDELQIRSRDADLEVKALSGGNQQKVVFAKWLVKPPKVLLLDEPTRGVDVGGKAEIYHTINRLAAAGTAIVMVSSELPEVLAMSDRILVMREGRQTAIFDAKAANQEQIITAATEGLRAS